MSELDIKEVHIVPVCSTGEVKDTDSKLDFYNSALVYLLNDKRSIYIGESIDIKNRFSSHNRHDSKKDLLIRHAIYSHLFNKSVTLHLEAFLINLFSAEKGLKLINLGNNGHYYHQKKEYEVLFPQIWKQLEELKIARTSTSLLSSTAFNHVFLQSC
ncbi:MAG: GIY-YIG nuclease family protein [Sphingobacterium sp.]|jgi:predicted GIY-YIG superfamily endonuclease|nr:GIY-YIG nuclease family protein [Sphingobacterium sp.]MDR0262558.1 GIY-YIG nuclease family protein [Sphingobacterium sp.]